MHTSVESMFHIFVKVEKQKICNKNINTNINKNKTIKTKRYILIKSHELFGDIPSEEFFTVRKNSLLLYFIHSFRRFVLSKPKARQIPPKTVIHTGNLEPDVEKDFMNLME